MLLSQSVRDRNLKVHISNIQGVINILLNDILYCMFSVDNLHTGKSNQIYCLVFFVILEVLGFQFGLQDVPGDETIRNQTKKQYLTFCLQGYISS